MKCDSCRYLGDQCGGVEGDPGLSTLDPMSMTKRQLLQLACTLARVGTVLCDLGQVEAAAAPKEQPFIWDIEEPHAHY